MNFTICPKCKMQVLPKSDGTCPSCQTIISQNVEESRPKTIEPLKKNAASTTLKQDPSHTTGVPTTTRTVDKGIHDSSIVGNIEIAQKHFDQSYTYWEKSKYKEALKECDQAIEFAPDWSKAHNLHGVILEEVGKLDEAISEYREAIRLDPVNKDAKSNLINADPQEAAIARRRAKAATRISDEQMISICGLSFATALYSVNRMGGIFPEGVLGHWLSGAIGGGIGVVVGMIINSLRRK